MVWVDVALSESVPFSLRVRLGPCEVEVSGTRDDVLKTINDLPDFVTALSEAFGAAGFDIEASNVPPSAEPAPAPSASFVPGVYPSIQSSGNCSDAVVKLLETDWGRSTPRTLPELINAMKANAVHYPATTLSGVLNWLVRKGRVKRWKTEKGYVYVLSGANIPPRLQMQDQAQFQNESGPDSTGGE